MHSFGEKTSLLIKSKVKRELPHVCLLRYWQIIKCAKTLLLRFLESYQHNSIALNGGFTLKPV